MYESNDQHEISEPGLFVAAFFNEESNQAISRYIQENNIPNPVKASSLHTTIVYSKVPVLDFEPNHSVEVDVNTTYASIECWDVKDNKRCLVLSYFSPYLHFRFQEAMAAGATYDFPEYKPHVTLSYDVGSDFDIGVLPKPNFPIKIVGEYFEPIEAD